MLQVAAAKGLVVGDLSVTKGRVSIQYWSELNVRILIFISLSLHSQRQGLLIPKVDDMEDVQVGGARWILVVEKEASYYVMFGSIG